VVVVIEGFDAGVFGLGKRSLGMGEIACGGGCLGDSGSNDVRGCIAGRSRAQYKRFGRFGLIYLCLSALFHVLHLYSKHGPLPTTSQNEPQSSGQLLTPAPKYYEHQHPTTVIARSQLTRHNTPVGKNAQHHLQESAPHPTPKKPNHQSQLPLQTRPLTIPSPALPGNNTLFTRAHAW
jgi:hypothetical protein